MGCDFDEGHDGPHSFELVGQDIEGPPSRNLRQGAVRHFDYTDLDEDGEAVFFYDVSGYDSWASYASWDMYVPVEPPCLPTDEWIAENVVVAFRVSGPTSIPIPKTYEEALASPWAKK